MNLAFYISGHGLGHSVRSIEVIKALLRQRPGAELTVCTWAPDWIFSGSIPGVPVRRSKTDVGLIQLDNLRFDLRATLEELISIRAASKSLVENEAAFLREAGADAIVSDVPFLPLAAAERLGIPSVLFTNFTWDWIYSLYEGFGEVSAWIKSFYLKAALCLRLPFHGGMDALPNVKDVPLVARGSALTKSEARTGSGLPADRPVFVVSFTELNMTRAALERIAGLEDYLFACQEPLRIEAPNFFSASQDFTDLVRGADGVITKPGYSILAECIANETPMLYTDRGEFAEYPRLVEGIERYLKQAHIPSEELYLGNWGPYLNALLEAPEPPETTSTDGSEVAARRIVELIEG